MTPLQVVTGANGFIARHLIGRLEAAGGRVCAVSRQGNPGTSWEELWSESFPWREVKSVFHLAAFIPPNLEDSAFAQECLEHNALLTLKLAERVAQASNARFVYASSGQVYGFRAEPVREDEAPVPAPRACFYLASKLLGEMYVERTAIKQGLKAVTLRIGSCYGPGMPAKALVARFAEAALQAQPLPVWNGGVERYDMIEVSDVVELLLRASTSGETGLFHAGTGQAVSVSQIGQTVNEVFGNRAGLEVRPADGGPAGFAPLEMTKSLRAFGWAPANLEAGIGRYRLWLMGQ